MSCASENKFQCVNWFFTSSSARHVFEQISCLRSIKRCKQMHRDTTPTCQNCVIKGFLSATIGLLSVTYWPLIGNDRLLVAHLSWQPACAENHIAKVSFFVGHFCWQPVFAFSSWPIVANEWPTSHRSLRTTHSDNLGDCPWSYWPDSS